MIEDAVVTVEGVLRGPGSPAVSREDIRFRLKTGTVYNPRLRRDVEKPDIVVHAPGGVDCPLEVVFGSAEPVQLRVVGKWRDMGVSMPWGGAQIELRELVAESVEVVS